MPRAIRFSVFSASDFLRPKMLGAGIDQSMHSAAVLNGRSPGPCVGVGQLAGIRSDVAIRKNLFRVVGAPYSEAISSR